MDPGEQPVTLAMQHRPDRIVTDPPGHKAGRALQQIRLARSLPERHPPSFLQSNRKREHPDTPGKKPIT